MNKLFEQALAAEGVSGRLADVARSIYTQESSGGKNNKTSNAGARGGMQILPGTFNGVADKGWSIDNPEHNARAGIRYLAMLDAKSGGDSALTAAGYYGGPGGMEKARKGIAVHDPRNPNAPSTLEYGQQVAARVPHQASKANQINPLAMSDAQVLAMTPEVAAAPAFVPSMAPVPVPPVVAQVPVAPVEPSNPWLDSRHALPEPAPVLAEQLNYGGIVPQSPSLASAQPVQARLSPNFNMFKALRGFS